MPSKMVAFLSNQPLVPFLFSLLHPTFLCQTWRLRGAGDLLRERSHHANIPLATHTTGFYSARLLS